MGTVRVCKTKSGKYFVLKGVRKESILKHNDQRHVINERESLRALSSPFCVKLFATFQDKANIYFALEYCPGGELFQRLGKKHSFSPPVAKFYITEVFVALEHVQSHGLVYRDLKPENVMLDEEGHCKLVDFGFCRPCNETGRMHTLCGTPAYLSPEQLDGKLTNGYGKFVDWWSFGVLIYELLIGHTPFSTKHGESHYEIFLRILNSRIHFPLFFDSASKNLISALCHPSLENRLQNVEVIKKHPYFEIPWVSVQERSLVPPFVPNLKEGDDHYFRQYAESSLPGDCDEKEISKGEFVDF
jgi:protein kinase A